jgi:hypothetical protein
MMNRLVRGAGRTVPLAFLVPLVHPVPLVPLSPPRVAPLKRHQWSIDADTAQCRLA